MTFDIFILKKDNTTKVLSNINCIEFHNQENLIHFLHHNNPLQDSKINRDDIDSVLIRFKNNA